MQELIKGRKYRIVSLARSDYYTITDKQYLVAGLELTFDRLDGVGMQAGWFGISDSVTLPDGHTIKGQLCLIVSGAVFEEIIENTPELLAYDLLDQEEDSLNDSN